MSKQLSFYLTPKDLRQLEPLLRACGPLAVLHSRSPSSSPKVLPTFDIKEGGKDWLFLFLAREQDVSQILMEEVRAQGYWSIDDLKSPVAEFTRCFFDDARLRCGRIYFKTDYYDPAGKLVEKPTPFLEWADCILKTLKKSLKKSGNYYVGDDAAQWRAKGGKFIDGFNKEPQMEPLAH
jgi:hypothetical protein